MSLILLLLLGFVLFFGIPAIVFAFIDEWSYSTSLYFVAVTLTTVGFGDVLPMGPRDTFERGMYVVGIVGWLFLGLAFVSVLFTKVTKFYEKADKIITTRVASGLIRRHRFHACSCLRGQDCSAKVNAEEQLEREEDTDVEMNELENGTMKVDDVEDSVEIENDPKLVTNL